MILVSRTIPDRDVKELVTINGDNQSKPRYAYIAACLFGE